MRHGQTLFGDRLPPDPEFERFWEHYPKKVAKRAARRAWDKAQLDGAMIAKVHAVLDWQVPLWTDPEFTPHPATWLNAGRWEDEPPPPKPMLRSGPMADLARAALDTLVPRVQWGPMRKEEP